MAVTEKNPNAIKDLIKRLSPRLIVKVGIQGAEASKVHPESPRVTVVDIAAIHEFGLGNNPVRSWLRAWFDQNEVQLREDIRRGYRRVISGEINLETLGIAIGTKSVASIQERISTNIPPPLKPQTIERKESSTALIDTGLLRSSVTFVLDSGDMIGGFVP